MRLVIVVLVLMLCAIARAEDDEGMLETPPLGGIPERMDALEREWTEDIGTKGPVDDAAQDAEADEGKEDGLAVPEAEDEEAPVLHDPGPVPAKSAGPARPPGAGSAPRGKPKDDKPAAAGKPPVRDFTMPED